jgi:D-alanyl-D-alanine carboxypeptidase
VRAALAALVLGTAVSCTSITVASRASDAPRTPAAPALASPSGASAVASASAGPVAAGIPAAPTGPPDSPSATSAVLDGRTEGTLPASPALDAAVALPDLPPPTLDRRLKGKLKRILLKTVRKGPIAGLSVAVGMPDGSIWTGTAGNAEYAPPRPLTPDTGFAIASVTKTFIAALILQLVDEGKLSLDVPYGRWLPDGPRARTVTVRELLDHRSGIHDYFDSARYRAAIYEGDRDRVWTYDDILGLVKSGYCRPDRCYRYSNTNYVILGHIAEEVEGKPLNVLLRRRFFEPLGLDHTLLQPEDPTPLDAAHGFWRVGGRFIDHTGSSRVVPFMAAASVANAAGAIVSTPRDLVVWADALYGGDVLSRASRHAMLTFLPPEDYGLGVRRTRFAGRVAVGHRGSLRGFESSLWYFPQDHVSIALLSNQGLWLTDVPLAKIAQAVFRGGRRATQLPP